MSPPAAGNSNNAPSVLREELLRHMPLYRKALYFSVIVSLLILAPTLFMLEVYDRVINSRNNNTLLMLLILVIAAYVVMELLDLVRGEIMVQAGMAIDSALRARLFNRAFEANLLRPGSAGNTQIFSDLKTLRDFLPSPAAMAIMDTPASIIFLAILFVISPWLGVMASVGAVIQVIIAVKTERQIMPALTQANRSAIEAQNYASGALRSTQVIEAMGMLGSIRQRWMTMQRRFLIRQANASDHSGMSNAVGKFIQTTQTSLILGASCWLSLKGLMLGGGGMMIVASTLGGRALTPLTQLVAQWRVLVNARDAYRRLDMVLGSQAIPPPAMPLPPPKGLLTVEGVVAGAPGNPAPILRGVTFAVQPGEMLAVVGPSASGKTTLARLLTGIWPAAAGKVRLDGADIYAWSKEELGPHVGYLPQSVELFDGTVAENIARFGRVEPDKVSAAIALVGLGPLIESLPQGQDTRIGEDGAFLSGGQRQRVALARAVYGMPRLLILDEPNSSLDDAGEQALLQTLTQLKAAGCALVVNSHRTGVLSVADKMLVLREGQVAAFGPAADVLAALQKAAAQAQPPVAQAGAVAGAAGPAARLPLAGQAGAA